MSRQTHRADFSKISDALIQWGEKNSRSFPWRKNLPFWKGLLVEVMLQRTRATQVVPVFVELDQKYPSFHSLSLTTKTEIRRMLAPLGLNWRIANFLELISALSNHRGRLPKNVLELTKLPGVGFYTANAAMSLHGRVRGVLVDTNTVRVFSRILGRDYNQGTRRSTEFLKIMDEATPQEQHRLFNIAVLDLAALICAPETPNCRECPAKDECRWFSESTRLKRRI